MTITIEKANEILNNLKDFLVDEVSLSRGMKLETYEENGWTYKVFYDNGTPKKIEEYNHRELIEIYVK